jgi:hypothetical protein
MEKQHKVSEKSLANLIPFVKGDPRCHRGGRPKSFDQLRKLAIKIMREDITIEETEETISTIENILRDWTKSKDIKKQIAAVEYAYGKVPDKLEHVLKDNIVIDWTGQVENNDKG